ncbi:MAG TPA: hypothetical protein VJH23_06450 [archaeon]|nr:hypothetical protein [archaeon]
MVEKMRREIRSLRKGLNAEKKKSGKLRKGIATARKKTAKTAKTVAARAANLGNEMNRLRVNLQNLAKKKTPKKQLSEYNLFMRRQLIGGSSFNRAVKQWKAYTMGTHTAPKKAAKRAVAPRIVTKIRTVQSGLNKRELLAGMRSALTEFSAESDANVAELKETMRKAGGVTKHNGNGSMSDERVAIEIISVFFQEVHRLGMKRSLELDDVVNSYFDTLSRVKGMKQIIKPEMHPVPTAVSDKLSSHQWPGKAPAGV